MDTRLSEIALAYFIKLFIKVSSFINPSKCRLNYQAK